MSAKMITVLREVGNFKHQVFPIEIYNSKDSWNSSRPQTPDFKSGVPADSKTHECLKEHFGLLHLPETSNVIDYKKSTYHEHPNRRRFKQVALNEPPEGYPPIFRIDHELGTLIHLCVSAAAKEALEAADVKGVRFIELIDS
jgi:hypothetical protein